MTIRKITGRTPSLAVSATTTRSNIVKATVSQTSGIKSLGNVTSRLVPKIANASTRIIDHLLYGPDGFGLRNLYNDIFIGSDLSIFTNKYASSSFDVLESILLKEIRNRGSNDTLTANEAIAFLLAQKRTFNLVAAVSDRPALFFGGAPIRDTQSFLDFVSIVRVKNFNETIASNDEITRLITAKRTFNDAVGMVDNFTFIDGSTYSLNRLIGEFITIGSETDIRTSGNAKENISFFMDKVLDPDMELLSHISLYNNKGVRDFQDLLDLKALEFRTQFNEVFNTESRKLLDVRKPFSDVVFAGTTSQPSGSITSSGTTVFQATSSQYLSTNVLPVGTSVSATYEWWAKTTTSTGTQGMLSIRSDSANTNGFDVYFVTSSLRIAHNSTTFFNDSSATVTVNTWNHFAIIRNGLTRWFIYVNGQSRGSFTLNTVTNTSLSIGRTLFSGGAYFNGYITDFRYVRGRTLYYNNFTPPTTASTILSGSSSGTVSANFNGSSNYYTVPNSGTSSAFVFTGDFTVEGWFFPQAVSGTRNLFQIGSTTGTAYVVSLNGTSVTGLIRGGTEVNWSQNVFTSTWNHIAVVRSGGIIRCYFNGIANATTDAQAGTIGDGFLNIGGLNFGGGASNFYNGNIFSFRVVSSAVYTSNFTAPGLTPITAIPGTQLLITPTSASGIDNDNSPNNFTILVNGPQSASNTTPYLAYSTELLLNMSTAGTQLTDSSPNNLTVTAVNSPTFATEGPFSSILSQGSNRFSGDQLENFSYFFDKVQADTTPMLDNFDLGDDFLFDYVKRFSELLPALDLPQLGINKVLTSLSSAEDFINKTLGKGLPVNVQTADGNYKYLGKSTTDALSFLENILIVRGRQYLDLIGTADVALSRFTKLLADTVIADDPVVRLADGLNSYMLMSRYDVEPVVDDFKRLVQFIRYPYHGYQEYPRAADPEFPPKLIKIDARAGALSTVPIWRTNRLSWSEEFQQPYWIKAGLDLSTNTVVPPINLVSSNSVTYDADQIQELFYNKPLDVYAKQWYQLAPTRWNINSNGDKLVATTNSSQHYLASPVLVELDDGQRYGASIYAKYAGVRHLQISAGTGAAVFDVSSGTIISRSNINLKVSIQPVGPDGWWLCEIGGLINAFGDAPELQEIERPFWNTVNNMMSTPDYLLIPLGSGLTFVKYSLLDNDLERTWAGDGTAGIHVWGAQVETGEQVEQEVGSLRYIRTAGGPASRFDYRIMPHDRDRVYVGTMLRDGSTKRVWGDPFENVSFILQQKIDSNTQLAIPVDNFYRSVNQSIYPGLNGYSSLAVSVTVGLPTTKRYAGDPQELIAFWFDKNVKRSGSSTAAVQRFDRTNILSWSERFDYSYWLKTNVRASTGISVMAGALPVRNVVIDANQINEFHVNKKNSYAVKRWWDVVPLRNKASFTSNTVVDIFESSSNTAHTVETFGFSTNLSNDYFASSIYANNANGVNRFRLQVGTVYADFDLSSVSVISSSGTLYTNIRVIDSSTSWYLCQIIGPTVALGTVNYLELLSTSDNIQLLRWLPAKTVIDAVSAGDLSRLLPNVGRFDTQPVSDFVHGRRIVKNLSETRNISRSARFDATRVMGIELVSKTSSSVDLARFTPLSTRDSSYYAAWDWYSLTPLFSNARYAAGNAGLGPVMIDNMALGDDFTYAGQIRLNSADNFVRLSSIANLLINKQPEPVFNTVTVGGIDGFRRQPTEGVSSETLRFDFKLNFYENRGIPTIPQYDAEMISELFYNTRKDIDGTKYTPTSGGYVYRRKTDWYNLVTRFARPRIAFGPGDRRGPVTYDNFQIADGFTYDGKIVLNSDDNFTVPTESISKQPDVAAKIGRWLDVYVGSRSTPYDADQIVELFYNQDGGYGKKWYLLAPLYSSYDHIKRTPWDRDFVLVGALPSSVRNLYWRQERTTWYLDKFIKDTTTMLDSLALGDSLLYEQTKLLQDLLIAGSNEGYRTAGNPVENVSFVHKMVAKRAGERFVLTFDISNNTTEDAELTAETATTTGSATKAWYKLAPYYSSYVNLIDEPTGSDRVRIGSQTSGKRTNADPFERVSFFQIPATIRSTITATERKGNYLVKELSETRMIPQNPRFDAVRVMGLDLVGRTTSTVNLTQYTPLSGGTTFYAARDWYSEVPKFNRARFALGNAGRGPIMIDNMSFGDSLTYDTNKFLSSISVVIGGDGGFRKQSGESTSETLSIWANKYPKQGVFTDLYVKSARPSPLYADQVFEIFYNSSNANRAYTRTNPFRRRWYQLAPYYNSYDHIKTTPANTDRVIVGSTRLGRKHAGWPLEIVDVNLGKFNSSTVVLGNNLVDVLVPDGGLSLSIDLKSGTGSIDLAAPTATGEPSLYVMDSDAYFVSERQLRGTESTTRFVQKSAKRTGTSSVTRYDTRRINYLNHSINLATSDWTKVNAPVVQTSILLNRAYPYKNVTLDAAQVNTLFYATSNNVTAYTYYNNYYGRRWYAEVAPSIKPAFTSNALHALTESTILAPHYIEANANIGALDSTNQFATFSLYAQKTGSARKFRMDVGRSWADFDLNTGVVVTSTGTRFNKITPIDTAAGIYLCQIIAPVQTFRTEFFNRSLSSTAVMAEAISFTQRNFRTFADSSVMSENITNDLILDLVGASGGEDLESLSGTFDLTTP